jgi:hypothetical protein
MRPIQALLLAAIPAVPAASQTVPTRTIVRPAAAYAEPFSEIRDIRELRDGRVIVVDGRELTVQLVDMTAGSATTIGRTGEGPGEYRWPGRLYQLPGDSTLLHDQSGGRLLIIGPDGKPGDLYDPNRNAGEDERARAFRFFVQDSDTRGRLYGRAQPIRIGANGQLELADSAAIVRLDRASGRRDTVAMLPERRDANAQMMGGVVMTQPRMTAFPAWDHWALAGDGRVASITFDPYRVEYFDPGGSTVRGAPIPYTRIRLDDALKELWKAESSAPAMAMQYSRAGGTTTIGPIRRPYREPSEWPEFLPPYRGSSVFGPDGMLWIPRAVAAGQPPLYDIIDRNGRLVERVQLPARHKLVGFGRESVYLVRLDDDDLQYLGRYPLPTASQR